MPSYRPLPVVTFRLLVRRWPLYLLTCAAVIALQTALAHFTHLPNVKTFVELIGSPLVIVVATVFSAADATGKVPDAPCWERIVERGWAIVLIDFGLSFISANGRAGVQSNDATNILYGFLTLLLGGMLVYAEPFAALQNEVSPLTLIPFAMLRSMTLAWVNFSRILALTAVQIGLGVLLQLGAQYAGQVGIDADTWFWIVLQTLLSVPLAILFTVAYLDTQQQEQELFP